MFPATMDTVFVSVPQQLQPRQTFRTPQLSPWADGDPLSLRDTSNHQSSLLQPTLHVLFNNALNTLFHHTTHSIHCWFVYYFIISVSFVLMQLVYD